MLPFLSGALHGPECKRTKTQTMMPVVLHIWLSNGTPKNISFSFGTKLMVLGVPTLTDLRISILLLLRRPILNALYCI